MRTVIVPQSLYELVSASVSRETSFGALIFQLKGSHRIVVRLRFVVAARLARTAAVVFIVIICRATCRLLTNVRLRSIQTETRQRAKGSRTHW